MRVICILSRVFAWTSSCNRFLTVRDHFSIIFSYAAPKIHKHCSTSAEFVVLRLGTPQCLDIAQSASMSIVVLCVIHNKLHQREHSSFTNRTEVGSATVRPFLFFPFGLPSLHIKLEFSSYMCSSRVAHSLSKNSPQKECISSVLTAFRFKQSQNRVFCSLLPLTQEVLNYNVG